MASVLLSAAVMTRLAATVDPTSVVEFGGGRKGAFLLLRYVFIIAACYLLVFEHGTGSATSISTGVMAALALASNLVLSLLSSRHLFTWYVEAPVLVADAVWVSWALHSTGAVEGEFFLLYLFVLFVAASGRHLPIALLGGSAAGVVHACYVWNATEDPTRLLLRICFFFAVALFYGTVLTQIRRERDRAQRGFSWAATLRREVGKRTVELEQLYHEAQAANRVKDDFVAGMSHELRTPIHIVVGYAEMLVAGDLAEIDARDIGRRIKRVALQLQGLVDGVLDLGRTEAGRQPLTFEPIDVPGFFDAFRRRERAGAAPGVEIRWQIAPDIPVLETDPQKLAVILDNLVNNALKFTEAGSVTISATNLSDRGRIALRVDDTGCGIAPAMLARVFEPFHDTQLPARDGQPRGVGLGLAIVKRYVDLLGGTIRVHSEVGRGCRFEVELPYAPTRPKTEDRRHAA